MTVVNCLLYVLLGVMIFLSLGAVFWLFYMSCIAPIEEALNRLNESVKRLSKL